MKTITVGTIGTVTTWTLHQWSDVLSVIAGALTVLYMVAKWVVLIRELKRKGKQ